MDKTRINVEKVNTIKKPELLAPAGDLERLKIAFLYGADAVYLGGTLFGLRANAVNFTKEDMKEGVLFAHSLGKKVYVTVNIVLHNKEMKLLVPYLKELEAIGVDAIIVSDPAIILLAKEHTSLEIHLSTQQSTLNQEACAFWKSQGVSRIVMAREASKEDLKAILNTVDIELECFIHGAMCASYSGRCVLSNFLTDRDSNRGGCSQICRWDFDLKTKDGKKIEAEKDFTFCTKDLSMLAYIPEMIEMGISSFKIEGRMRSSYYIATIVHVYRKVIDEYCNNKNSFTYNEAYEKVLRNCANRDNIAQFFNGIEDARSQYYNGRVEISNQDFLALILSYDASTSLATIEQRNYFKVGDAVTIFGPHHEDISFVIHAIYQEDLREIQVARHPKEILKIKVPCQVEKCDMMRIDHR